MILIFTYTVNLNPLANVSKSLFLIFNMTHNFDLQHEVWMVDIQYPS
jgi:hypothetical protein